MWEWSNKIINGPKADSKDTSLLSAYNDLLKNAPQPPSIPEKIKDIEIAAPLSGQAEPPSVDEMRRIVEKKISGYKLKNLSIVEKNYQPQSWQEMSKIFSEYQRARIIFFKLLAYSEKKACLKAGLTQSDLSLLKQGYAPENFNTHIKIPFDFGGSIDFSNLVLIKTHPCHDRLHKIIDMQIDNNFLRTHKKIFLPYFEGKVYYG